MLQPHAYMTLDPRHARLLAVGSLGSPVLTCQHPNPKPDSPARVLVLAWVSLSSHVSYCLLQPCQAAGLGFPVLTCKRPLPPSHPTPHAGAAGRLVGLTCRPSQGDPRRVNSEVVPAKLDVGAVGRALRVTGEVGNIATCGLHTVRRGGPPKKVRWGGPRTK